VNEKQKNDDNKKKVQKTKIPQRVAPPELNRLMLMEFLLSCHSCGVQDLRFAGRNFIRYLLLSLVTQENRLIVLKRKIATQSSSMITRRNSAAEEVSNSE